MELVQEVSLMQMLEARDYRVERQHALLMQYNMPLVSFTMNIAGPVKNSPLILRGFQLGRDLLFGQLQRVKAALIWKEEIYRPTGCEGLYVIDMAPLDLKALCCDLEEASELGRLYDMDVLTPDGCKLDRPAGRVCLLCGRPAKDCARSRTHTVAELQSRTREILTAAVNRFDEQSAASLCVKALLYEVNVTPKPGLVDRRNSGSHHDMDTYTFMSSASCLWPYFCECVRIGRQTASEAAKKTFSLLRFPGKLAEAEMLSATSGVNTHKGAIFSLGLVCGALGRLDREHWSNPDAIMAQVSEMAAGVEAELHRPSPVPTDGERLYQKYGITGVRGQASAGFPSVLQYGLPVLELGLAAGKTEDEAGAAALLSILAHTHDTNMAARGGHTLACKKSDQLLGMLSQSPFLPLSVLYELDQEYIRENLSPGGSADLLALCWLLHFLRKGPASD